MNIELERLADLLAKLIEKYAERIDWASLPDPPKPGKEKPATENEVAGFFGLLRGNAGIG